MFFFYKDTKLEEKSVELDEEENISAAKKEPKRKKSSPKLKSSTSTPKVATRSSSAFDQSRPISRSSSVQSLAKTGGRLAKSADFQKSKNQMTKSTTNLRGYSAVDSRLHGNGLKGGKLDPNLKSSVELNFQKKYGEKLARLYEEKEKTESKGDLSKLRAVLDGRYKGDTIKVGKVDESKVPKWEGDFQKRWSKKQAEMEERDEKVQDMLRCQNKEKLQDVLARIEQQGKDLLEERAKGTTVKIGLFDRGMQPAWEDRFIKNYKKKMEQLRKMPRPTVVPHFCGINKKNDEEKKVGIPKFDYKIST